MITKNEVCGFLLGISLLSLTGCGSSEAPPVDVARPVKMMTIAGFSTEGGARSYPGKVEANKDVILSFEVSGKLRELKVDKGQEVKKGDIIAILESERLENEYREKKAQHTQAVKDYERNQSLYEKGAISAASLDSFLRQRDVAKAALAIALKDFNDTVLRAPFDGVVATKSVENFQAINAKEEIVRFQDVSSFRIRVSVPESVMGSGKSSKATIEEVNQMIDAVAKISSIPGREFPVALVEVETEADPATRTFEVTFGLALPDDTNILPGMTAVVDVTRNAFMDEKLPKKSPNEFRIPAVSVVADPDGKQSVWLVKEGDPMTVTRQYVTTGDIHKDEISVTEGLAAGQTIATSGASALREGMKVKRMKDPSESYSVEK